MVITIGVLYHRWEKYDLAEIHYKQALEIDPKMQKAKHNLALLHKHLDELNQPVLNIKSFRYEDEL